MSPLWRGPGNIYGLVLDGKSYRQTLTATAVSGVRITTLLLRMRNLTSIVCGR